MKTPPTPVSAICSPACGIKHCVLHIRPEPMNFYSKRVHQKHVLGQTLPSMLFAHTGRDLGHCWECLLNPLPGNRTGLCTPLSWPGQKVTTKGNSVHQLVAGYDLDSNVFIPWGSGQPAGPGINGSPVCVDSFLGWIPAQPGSSISSQANNPSSEMLSCTACPGQIPLLHTIPALSCFLQGPDQG